MEDFLCVLLSIPYWYFGPSRISPVVYIETINRNKISPPPQKSCVPLPHSSPPQKKEKQNQKDLEQCIPSFIKWGHYFDILHPFFMSSSGKQSPEVWEIVCLVVAHTTLSDGCLESTDGVIFTNTRYNCVCDVHVLFIKFWRWNASIFAFSSSVWPLISVFKGCSRLKFLFKKV